MDKTEREWKQIENATPQGEKRKHLLAGRPTRIDVSLEKRYAHFTFVRTTRIDALAYVVTFVYSHGLKSRLALIVQDDDKSLVVETCF